MEMGKAVVSEHAQTEHPVRPRDKQFCVDSVRPKQGTSEAQISID